MSDAAKETLKPQKVCRKQRLRQTFWGFGFYYAYLLKYPNNDE